MAVVFALSDRAWSGPKDIPDRPPRLTFDKPVDYVGWYNDFVRRGRDEKDNAYHVYMKLCPGKDCDGIKPPEGKAAEQFDRAIGRVWTAEEFPELASYLKDCEPYENILKEALRRKYCWVPAPPTLPNLVEITIPFLASARTIAKAMLVKGWKEGEGRMENQIEAWRSILRHATHMESCSMIITGFVAVSLRTLVHEDILRALGSGSIPADQCALLFDELATLEKSALRQERIRLVEWAMELNFLQHFYQKTGGDVKKWESYRPYLEALGMNIGDDFKPDFDFKASAELFDELNSDIAISSGNSPTRKGLRRLRDAISELRPKIAKNSFVKLVAPNRIRSYELALRIEAERRGTLIVLVLHAEYAKKGKWPESLTPITKELKVKTRSSLAIDPYSGKMFVYRLNDGEPLLYSVGVDGKDDGGKHDPKFGEENGGDYVFWPRATK
ncbi:MAG TPA: hypothetical protein VJZ71_10725 [Phycisphaerae bacterium]|nr:hypothetical protein [Phycisphaerae bacterium]